MGFFRRGKGDKAANELAATALGKSVTPERLTTTTKRMAQGHLSNLSLMETLREGEQPHYYFYNAISGVTKGSKTVGAGYSTGYRSICVVTDERILFITKGDLGEYIPFSVVKDVTVEKGNLEDQLTIMTDDVEYTMKIAGQHDGDEIEAAREYILEKAGTSSKEWVGVNVIEGFRQIWAPGSHTFSLDEALRASPQGGYVTRERVEKVKDILAPGEKVHYLTQGTTIDVEGSSAGKSLYGDDRSRKFGSSGNVRAVITDNRVVIKIPQFLGDDTRSLPYPNITSVDLDTGLLQNRITLQTPGQTYHIQAINPDKGEVRDIVDFIRTKMTETNQPMTTPSTTSSESDPLYRLRQLKTLHDDGVISDGEFEEKKSSLLDEI